jgi:D-alanine-D-alanine ligase
MERIVVLYNTDYEAAPDAKSVADAAKATCDALVASGHRATLRGLRGLEVFEVIPALREADLVFNLCESMNRDSRNEPTFAGLLDLFGIAYTGADLLGLSSCLYKYRAKEVLIARGIPTPKHVYLEKLDEIPPLEYPYFVKLAHEDASLGITEKNVVRSEAELRARAAALMAEFKQGVIAERYIEGREINVTLIGNADDLRILPLHEIDFSDMPSDRPNIISYAAKWDESHVDYDGTKPVPLRGATPELVAAIENTARAAYLALGLRDYGRVDLRLDAQGTPWVIDVNPNCDISPDAGFSRAAKVAGMSYPQLIDAIAQVAWRRITAKRSRSKSGSR